MLRSYAAAGLLVPAAVDGSSGYRYYSTGQLHQARIVVLFRRAGIAVDEIAGATHIGGRETNEDAVLVSEGLFAVADGIGGLQDGEVASRLALDTLDAAFAADRTVSGLLDACQEANRAVWGQANGRDNIMGTTLAALAMTSDAAGIVLHAGDSRLYRLRHGRLEQLTHDHTVIADLIRAGELSEADARTHPHRFVLTRAIGVFPHVDVDHAGVSCEPGDRLLLCSDGLFKALAPGELKAILASEAEPQRSADQLVADAVAREKEDNVTAMIIDVH